MSEILVDAVRLGDAGLTAWNCLDDVFGIWEEEYSILAV